MGKGRDDALQALEPLIGEWDVEAEFPGAAPTGVVGRTAFEWVLDGQFLVERSRISVEGAPDSLAIIGRDGEGEGFTQHYFDSRGVVRIYAMGFSDSVWTLLRDSPDFSPLDFWQRFTGPLDEKEDAIRGRWETSNDGSSWELDFDLTYTRVK